MKRIFVIFSFILLLFLFYNMSFSKSTLLSDNFIGRSTNYSYSDSLLKDPYGVCWHITKKYQEADYLVDGLKQCTKICQYVRSDLNLYDYLDRTPPLYWPENEFIWIDSISNSLQEKGLVWLPIITGFEKLEQNQITYERLNNYKEWIRLISNHFASRIHYWEVTNEMDLWQERNKWSDDIVINIYKYAFEGIKEGNPSAEILIGGVSNINNGYLERVMSLGAWKYFNIMNFHVYLQRKYIEYELINRVKKLKSILNSHNVDYPIWLTETGCNTFSYTEDDQLSILPRVFITSFACGIDKTFFYCLRDIQTASEGQEQHFGLTYNDINKPKISLQAFETLVKYCPTGSTIPVLSNDSYLYVAKWKTPDLSNVNAIWSKRLTKVRLVYNQTSPKIINSIGEQLPINNYDEILVDDHILYLFGVDKIEVLSN